MRKPRDEEARAATGVIGVTDVDFDSAGDVTSIGVRLHPIDIGFDLRVHDIAVVIPPDPTLRVSYPTIDGTRRVMSGPRADVMRRLRRLGFRFV